MGGRLIVRSAVFAVRAGGLRFAISGCQLAALDRELEVLELLGRRHNTKSIASLLHLRPKTIETHRVHIKEKLRFKQASELIHFAIDWLADTERK
jgi:DNA-binding NarL/FixJ family response regulator